MAVGPDNILVTLTTTPGLEWVKIYTPPDSNYRDVGVR